MESRDVQYISVKTTVNGFDYEFEVEPRETLLDLIRNRLGLKGAKLSCDMEVCGACHDVEDAEQCNLCHSDLENPRAVPRVTDYFPIFSHP